MLLAALAPLLPLAVPLKMDVAHRLAVPSRAHWLGQDEYGRDVLSRLIWGARVSLAVAAGSTALACVVGTVLGLVGGFLGKLAEFFAIRSMDAVLCFPPLLLALLVVTLLGPGAATLIPVLALVYLPGFTRVAYGGVVGSARAGLCGGGAGARRRSAAHPGAHRAAQHRRAHPGPGRACGVFGGGA